MAAGKPTTCKEAIRRWEEENEQTAATGTEVILSFQWPPVEKMDNALATLVNCEKLFLSTNIIKKVAGNNRHIIILFLNCCVWNESRKENLRAILS